MGYDFHITRREDWSEEGDDITAEEWLSCVERDPELRLLGANGPYFAIWSGQCELDEPWLNWSYGQIYTKNPDEALIDKMVAIARNFGASVQGDDGEIYQSGAQAFRPRPVVPVQPAPTFAERAIAWLGGVQPQQSLRFRLGMEAYRAGERLEDPWGREHIVVRIENRHGVRVLYTRRTDGTEIGHLLPVYHFFIRIGKG